MYQVLNTKNVIRKAKELGLNDIEIAHVAQKVLAEGERIFLEELDKYAEKKKNKGKNLLKNNPKPKPE
jgi:hypothetical protein